LIDTHCHLYLSQFDNDLDDVITGAVRDGIQRILVPGIDVATSKKSIKLSSKYSKNIFSAIGIHPNYSENSNTVLILKLLKSQRHRIFAIGEIGLDFYRDYSPRDTQIEVFSRMLEFAKEFNLPICIHNRKADLELLSILDKWYCKSVTDLGSTNKGVFHAFSGSEKIADWGIAHDFTFGIGGQITYNNSDQMRNAVKWIGLSHLVLETDAPYLSPVPFRGKRNIPQYLVLIAKSLAEIFDCTVRKVIDKTDENANRLFGFK
jgi:TatD DNase family protein